MNTQTEDLSVAMTKLNDTLLDLDVISDVFPFETNKHKADILVINSAINELRRLHEVNQELVEVLKAFDVAAKESQTIIGFAGRSLKLLTQARAALAKATGENT